MSKLRAGLWRKCGKSLRRAQAPHNSCIRSGPFTFRLTSTSGCRGSNGAWRANMAFDLSRGLWLGGVCWILHFVLFVTAVMIQVRLMWKKTEQMRVRLAYWEMDYGIGKTNVLKRALRYEPQNSYSDGFTFSCSRYASLSRFLCIVGFSTPTKQN